MSAKRKQLLQRKADLVKDSRALLEQSTGGVTPDLQAQYDLKKADIESINTELSMMDELDALDRETAGTVVQEAVQADAQGSMPKPFKSFGEQLQAIIRAGMGQGVDPRLEELNRYEAAASGGNTYAGAEGAFLIQTDYSTEVQRRSYELGTLTQKCRQIEISSASNKTRIPYIDEDSRANGSRLGGVQVYRTAEAGTVEASKPKLGYLEIDLEKMMGLAYLTEEVMQDAPALESIYKECFAEEFAFKTDGEIFEGTGVGQCQGVKGSTAAVSVAKESGQSAASLEFENITKMWARMWARSRFSANWYINQELETELYGLQMTIGTGGVPVYLPPGALSASPYGSLFGRPVIPIEHADAPGTKGDISLLDLSQYLLAQKGGMQTDMSMHVRFIYGENTLRITQRINGLPAWKKPLTPFKGTNTLSPFVFLETRA